MLIWAMTTGEAGMRSQALGLAQAVGGTIVEKTVRLRAPWPWLPGHWVPESAIASLHPASDPIGPPWPDLVITCGRRSTGAAIAMKRKLGDKLVTVHVQNPRCQPAAFDLVIAMAHDGLTGPNVAVIDTALNTVSDARVAEAAEIWRPRFAHLPRPLTGVLLGGQNKAYRFTPERTDALIADLDRVKRGTGGSVLITPSRRTGDDVKARIAAHYANDPAAYVWDGRGDNPFLGILALSDRLVVTSESVSMISEALATPHPVEVFRLEGHGRRHELFVDTLVEKGLVRIFGGDPVPPRAGGPINATADMATRVHALLKTR